MQELHTVNVLGTEYKIILIAEKEDPRLKDLNGCCDPSTKEILVEKNIPEDDHSLRNLEDFRRKVIRHELVHAFLYESGLHEQCCWATNEEIIDWIAIQLPKMLNVISKVNCL